MIAPADPDRAGTKKRERTRLAKAEVWMLLAGSAQRHADQVGNVPGYGTIPFEMWPPDDPLRELAARYGLTGAELSKVIASVAEQIETRAFAAGYDDHWEED